MNRKERRAALKTSSRIDASTRSQDGRHTIDSLILEAGQLYQEGQFKLARDLCRRALTTGSFHPAANNLQGVILQALGRDKLAVQHFAKAVAAENENALYHYNIGFSYQRLGMWSDAVAHFSRALALRMGGKPVEDYVKQYPPIAACLSRISQQWPRRLTFHQLFEPEGSAAVVKDAFLRCALEQTEFCSLELEDFLTAVRFALLQLTAQAAPEFIGIEEELGFFAAMAQQCFINEYLLAQSDDETQTAEDLRMVLTERLATGENVSPLLLITVAAYFPLYQLSGAGSLRDRLWPPVVHGLLRQQLFEPSDEMQLRGTIPSLTAIQDNVSTAVRAQYEENPYPRWTTLADASVMDDWRTRHPPFRDASPTVPTDILVAGCGTGQNAIHAALSFPAARVLAIDLSLASLAYAVRKTREARVHNVEYAQADIVQAESVSRRFDRIEAIGVLHHLADPLAGWRSLLTLLRPGGVMDVGLYSETARRAIIAAHEFAASGESKGTTTESIRLFRQKLRFSQPWFAKDLFASADFYTASGCRDLVFHTMEHRFSLADIARFLRENELTFLGFRVRSEVSDQFRVQFSDPASLANLDRWEEFENSHPKTFASMYRFAVRKGG